MQGIVSVNNDMPVQRGAPTGCIGMVYEDPVFGHDLSCPCQIERRGHGHSGDGESSRGRPPVLSGNTALPGSSWGPTTCAAIRVDIRSLLPAQSGAPQPPEHLACGFQVQNYIIT